MLRRIKHKENILSFLGLNAFKSEFKSNLKRMYYSTGSIYTERIIDY